MSSSGTNKILFTVLAILALLVILAVFILVSSFTGQTTSPELESNTVDNTSNQNEQIVPTSPSDEIPQVVTEPATLISGVATEPVVIEVPTNTPVVDPSTPTPSCTVKVNGYCPIEDGVLIVAVQENFPPFSYIDSSGNRTGLDVEIAREFAKRWGLELRLLPVPSPDRIPSVKERRADIAIAAITHTLSRCAEVSCSEIYFVDGARIVVNVNSDIEGICDLSGGYVAVLEGTTAVQAVPSNINRWCPDGFVTPLPLEYPERQDALNAVRNGVADAYSTDGLFLETLASNDSLLVVRGREFTREPYTIISNINAPELTEWVSITLDALKQDGKYDDLHVAEFGCSRAAFPIIATNDPRVNGLMASGIMPQECAFEATTYMIQEGDLLGGIALTFYGEFDLYTCLANVNEIPNASLIQPGVQIYIPAYEDCVSE